MHVFVYPNSVIRVDRERSGSEVDGPNKHGLVTYIQVNVYIGNTLSWFNGSWAFKTDVC